MLREVDVKVRIFYLLLLVAGGLYGAPLRAEEELPLGVVHEEAFQKMELLAQVLLQVRKHYVDELSYEDLLQGAIRGMLGELDPHSAFLDQEEYQNLLDEASGSYGGIGIQIGIRDNTLTVIAPIEGTPAFRAGVQSGDRILSIDGESTSGIALREAVKLLRGEEGTSVRLTIMGRDATEEEDIEMIRERIAVTSVKGARILGNGIGYVRITQFDSQTAASFREALEDLERQGMEALILDLRSNPGGLLQQAIRTAGIFLEEGLTVVSTRGREGANRNLTFGAESSVFVDMPLVVMVNRGSASGSEIVAGAIQDHGRGILIGEKTYGKASVQTVLRMGQADGDAAIRLTTAQYVTPNGRQIQDIGIHPDIEIPLEREEWRRVQMRRSHLESPENYPDDVVAEYADVEDRQLQRAQDLLEALLILQKKP